MVIRKICHYGLMALSVFLFVPGVVRADVGNVIWDTTALSLNSSHPIAQDQPSWSYDYYSGFQYYATTTTIIGGIDLMLNSVSHPTSASSTEYDYIVMVMQGTTTGSIYELSLVGSALYETLPDYDTQVACGSPCYYTQFEFTDGLYVEAGTWYTFIVRPLFTTGQYFANLRDSETYVSVDFPTIDYNVTTDTTSPYTTRTPLMRIYDYTYNGDDAPIDISVPCETNSYSSTRCAYGWESTSTPITISGTSTPNMSWPTGMYGIYAHVYSPYGELLDVDAVDAPDGTSVDFTLTVGESGEIPYYEGDRLLLVRVCQSGASGVYTYSPTSGLCAEFVVGYGLTTASSTALAQAMGLYVKPTFTSSQGGTDYRCEELDELSILDWNTWDFQRRMMCWSLEVYDYFVGGPDVETTWLTPITNKKDELVNLATSTWPLVYLAKPTYDLLDALTSTSSFEVGFDVSAFGLPQSTTTWNINAMANYAKVLADDGDENTMDLFEVIDWFIYAFFIFYVMLRINMGTWFGVRDAFGSYGTNQRHEMLARRGSTSITDSVSSGTYGETNRFTVTRRRKL